MLSKLQTLLTETHQLNKFESKKTPNFNGARKFSQKTLPNIGQQRISAIIEPASLVTAYFSCGIKFPHYHILEQLFDV